jgi:hypothetical protein
MTKRRKPSVEKQAPKFCVMPKRRPYLASALLFGEQTTSTDGRTTQRNFPRPGSEQELAARAALADELRAEAPWGHFVGLVAAMIDPRTEGALSRPQIKCSGHRGKNSKPRVTEHRDVEIAEHIQKRRAKNDREPVAESIWDAAEHFRLADSVICEVWNEFNFGKNDEFKIKPDSMWAEYIPKR